MIPKFRAWHHELGRMMLIKNMWFQDNVIEEFELNDTVMNDYITAYADEVTIMQSTGLLDKNGQEIWEGDVVRMRSGELLQVKLHHGMFVPVCFYVSSVFEREGNVFENPELLEDPDFRGVYDD